MENLRKSLKELLCLLFNKHTENPCNYANKFELELYSSYNEREYINYSIIIYDILLNNILYENNIIKKYIHNEINVVKIINYNIINKSRNKIITLFLDLLKNSHDYFINHNEKTNEIVKKIENSCYEAVLKDNFQILNNFDTDEDYNMFIELYSIRCGIIYNIIDPNSDISKSNNLLIINDIIDEKINIDEIGYKSEKELCPQSFKKEMDEINLRTEQVLESKSSSIFKCPKCKERKVSYKEVQLRSIDEAPDYICTCLHCKHLFKA